MIFALYRRQRSERRASCGVKERILITNHTKHANSKSFRSRTTRPFRVFGVFRGYEFVKRFRPSACWFYLLAQATPAMNGQTDSQTSPTAQTGAQIACKYFKMNALRFKRPQSQSWSVKVDQTDVAPSGPTNSG
jgi:hypothetical protein